MVIMDRKFRNDQCKVFGKSLVEVTTMMESLEDELSKAGLSTNAAKTKIMTTNSAAIPSSSPILVEIGKSFAEIVRCDECHKYLERWPGDVRARVQCNLEHRLTLSWMKFHDLHGTLTNQKVPVFLRLKLFDSIVTPTAADSL